MILGKQLLLSINLISVIRPFANEIHPSTMKNIIYKLKTFKTSQSPSKVRLYNVLGNCECLSYILESHVSVSMLKV